MVPNEEKQSRRAPGPPTPQDGPASAGAAHPGRHAQPHGVPAQPALATRLAHQCSGALGKVREQREGWMRTDNGDTTLDSEEGARATTGVETPHRSPRDPAGHGPRLLAGAAWPVSSSPPGPGEEARKKHTPTAEAAAPEPVLPTQTARVGRRQESVLLLVLIEVVVLLLVLPDVGHGGLHPGAAVLGPAGACGQHAVRTIGQVTGRKPRAI